MHILIMWVSGFIALVLAFFAANSVYKHTKNPITSFITAWAIMSIYAIGLIQYTKFQMHQANERFYKSMKYKIVYENNEEEK